MKENKNFTPKTYVIKTDLLTLEKVGDLLLDLDLGGLIGLNDKTEGKEKSISELILKLTAGRKVREFLNLVTGNAIGETIESSEIMAIIMGFFKAIGKDIGGVLNEIPIVNQMKK